MRRKLPSILLTLILFGATAQVSALAQSGRGRQLRIQATLSGDSVAPAAPEVQNEPPGGQRESGASKRLQPASRRSAGLIYNDASANQKKADGEYHVTRGDKTALWILLGAAVLATIVVLTQD